MNYDNFAEKNDFFLLDKVEGGGSVINGAYIRKCSAVQLIAVHQNEVQYMKKLNILGADVAKCSELFAKSERRFLGPRISSVRMARLSSASVGWVSTHQT